MNGTVIVGPKQRWYEASRRYFFRNVATRTPQKLIKWLDMILWEIDNDQFQTSTQKHVAYYKADYICQKLKRLKGKI